MLTNDSDCDNPESTEPMDIVRHQFNILKQICDLIPGHLVPKVAREYGVDRKRRTFDPWSHVDLFSLIGSCGTAGVRLRMRASPEQAVLLFA
jgi:hypothetical protein